MSRRSTLVVVVALLVAATSSAQTRIPPDRLAGCAATEVYRMGATSMECAGDALLSTDCATDYPTCVDGVQCYDTDDNALYVCESDVWTAGTPAHDLLSATHSDTTAGAVSRGSMIAGVGASPTWQEVVFPSSADAFLGRNANELEFRANHVVRELPQSGSSGAPVTVGSSFVDVSGIAYVDTIVSENVAYSFRVNTTCSPAGSATFHWQVVDSGLSVIISQNFNVACNGVWNEVNYTGAASNLPFGSVGRVKMQAKVDGCAGCTADVYFEGDPSWRHR